MNHVHHALRGVPGLVSIEAIVACRVLRLVFASHAIGAALRVSHVSTSAQASVVKNVIKIIATHVPIEESPESTSSR